MFLLAIVLLRSSVLGIGLTGPFPQIVVDTSQSITSESVVRGRKFWNLVRRKNGSARSEHFKHVGKEEATAISVHPDTTCPRSANGAITDRDGHVGEPQSDPSTAVTPGKNDKRYVIPPREVASHSLVDSTGRLLVAGVQDQDVNGGNRTSREILDAVAHEIQLAGAWRRIFVRFDGDPKGDRARVQQVMHDTGAGVSLTFKGKLESLGLDFERKQMGEFVSVTGEIIKPIGRRDICFSYYSKPEQKHWVNLFVLEDPNHEMSPGYDMLFGRDILFKTEALAWNLDVIGVNALRRLQNP